jgi:hypothetical protein
MPHADVPVGVEHAFVGEDAARHRQFLDRGRFDELRGAGLRVRLPWENQRDGNENGRHQRNYRCHGAPPGVLVAAGYAACRIVPSKWKDHP